MTLEVLLAWYGDYRRLKQLERKRVFKSGIAIEARQRIIETLERVAELAAIDRVVPYAGPTVTERSTSGAPPRA